MSEICTSEEIKLWLVLDTKIKTVSNTTIQSLLEHRHAGSILKYVYQICKLEKSEHISDALNLYNDIEKENWNSHHIHLRSLKRKENPNSRESLIRRLHELKQRKEELLKVYIAKKNYIKKTKRIQFSNSVKQTINGRLNFRLQETQNSICKSIKTLSQFEWSFCSLQSYPEFSLQKLSTLSVDIELLIKIVAGNSYLLISTNTDALEFFPLEDLLKKYPLSHLILALGFHLERLRDNTNRFVIEYESREKLQLEKLCEFENRYGRKPVGIQRFTFMLIEAFNKYQKKEITLEEILRLTSNASSTNDPVKTDNLGLETMMMVLKSIYESTEQKVKIEIHFSEQYLQKTFLSSLNYCYSSLMLTCGTVCESYKRISETDFSVYYPNSHLMNSIMSADHQTHLKQLKQMRNVLSKHFCIQLKESESKLQEVLKSRFELVSGPSLEIIGHNFLASLESCWSRQINQFLPSMQISEDVEKFNKLVEDVQNLESDRRTFFSPSFHRLLQENKLLE